MLSRRNARISHGLLVALAFLAFVVFVWYPRAIPPDTRRARQKTAGSPARQSKPQRRRDLAVNQAVNLQAFYQKNEIRADRDFKDRVAALRGVIRDIGTDILGTPYVAFEGPSDSFFCVQCFFAKQDESKLVSLNPGDTVTIAGTCTGKFGNVMIHDCWFYSIPPADRSESPADFRIWRTATYSIEAQFLKLEQGKVSLRNEKGSIINIPLQSLTEEDREYVELAVGPFGGRRRQEY